MLFGNNSNQIQVLHRNITQQSVHTMGRDELLQLNLAVILRKIGNCKKHLGWIMQNMVRLYNVQKHTD